MFSNLESTHMCRCCLYPPTTILGIFAILRSFLIILSKTYLQKHKSKTFKMNQALKFRKSVKKWLWESLICTAVTMYLHTYSARTLQSTFVDQLQTRNINMYMFHWHCKFFFIFCIDLTSFCFPICIDNTNFLYFLHWQVKFLRFLNLAMQIF